MAWPGGLRINKEPLDLKLMIFCAQPKSEYFKVAIVGSDFSPESKEGVINHHAQNANKMHVRRDLN